MSRLSLLERLRGGAVTTARPDVDGRAPGLLRLRTLAARGRKAAWLSV